MYVQSDVSQLFSDTSATGCDECDLSGVAGGKLDDDELEDDEEDDDELTDITSA